MIRSPLEAKQVHARILCKLSRKIAASISYDYSDHNLKKPALVFSPHFDDETLGCGGTIAKKKGAGARVKIVFMTDGSKSHSHLMAEDDLKAIRASEALAATRSLGLNTSDVFFLGFEETKLNEHVPAATDVVTEILLRTQPSEIFVPYQKDAHLDHSITTSIVFSALQMYDREVTLFEYPIWFWNHWPWTTVSTYRPMEILKSLKKSLVSLAVMLAQFRHYVYIADVLELKRAALHHYKSQMTRLVPDSRWLTLGDVSNGEFLECFLQEYEIFRHRFKKRR